MVTSVVVLVIHAIRPSVTYVVTGCNPSLPAGWPRTPRQAEPPCQGKVESSYSLQSRKFLFLLSVSGWRRERSDPLRAFFVSIRKRKSSSGRWECGNRAAISKGGGRRGKPAVGFPRRPRPGISTAIRVIQI